MSQEKIGLSFDDGPSRFTAPLLDVLADHGAHATFFLIGSMAEQSPELVRQIAAGGHELGNHTWSHPSLARDCDDDRVRSELQSTSDLLQRLVGRRPTLFRAPGYDCDERVRAIGAELGLRHADGDVTPPDWLPGARSLVIATFLLRGAAPGVVVGLHDGIPPDEDGPEATRQPTVEALGKVLPQLASRGLSCRSVSEVLAA
jgi:chitooligosaccharide deacetylase